MINNKGTTKGFTLVETLVSIAIFGLLSTALVNIFVSGIKTQARIMQNQELMEQSSYSLEYMGKVIRMAKKDEAGGCTGTANVNYGGTTTSIYFLAYDSIALDYRCRRFFLDTDYAIKEERSSDLARTFSASPSPLTSSRVKVNNIRFAVTGDGTDSLQPKTTIMMYMESNSTATNPPKLIIQTSISQRQLDIAE